MPTSKARKCPKGFTLAELLIALAILGVIATFTIPKVMVAQQNQKWQAGAKEFAGTISGSFIQYKQDGFPATPLFTSTYYHPLGLTPYMNYVSIDTSGTLDDVYGSGAPSVAPPPPASYCTRALKSDLGTVG